MLFFYCKVIFITIFAGLSKVAVASEEHGHDEGHEEISRSNLVDEIAEHIAPVSKNGNHTEFVFTNIEQLFKKLHFSNCTKKLNHTNCNLCLSPSEFMKWHGHSIQAGRSITEEEFRHLSVGLIYVLGERRSESTSSSNFSAVCKTFISSVILANNSSELFTQYLRKYDDESKGKLNEESVEKILGNINKTIGSQLTEKKCFSAHNVLESVNVSASGFGEHDLEYVSAFIILKLLNKNCINLEEHDHEHGHNKTTGEHDHDHDHDHDHGHGHNTTTNSTTKGFFVHEIFEEFGNGTHLTHEGFEKLYNKVVPSANTTTKSTSSHDGHDHRKRRSISEYRSRSRRSAEHEAKCFSGENVLEIFGIPEGSALSIAKFQEVCPALVQQVESGACSKAATTSTGTPTHDSTESWESWVGAMVSIAIISFGSLIGIVLFPGHHKKAFPFAIMFLVALGVAVLIGDALLHLIPHSLGLHDHEESSDGSHASHDSLATDSYIWKCMVVLAGMLLFLIFESLMLAYGSGHSHDHSHGHSHEMHPTEMRSPEPLKANEVNRDTDIVIPNDFVGNGFKNGHANGVVALDEVKIVSNKAFTVADVKSVAWMILIGDAVHNFMDGVAIGVAFSEPFPTGLHGGVSTSIAILCHELPHELGDFAVLINSGLSIKMALVLNLLSSLTAFVGGILGVCLGAKWNAAPWIFALTAGMFIYISLVVMLPQVMNSPSLKSSPKLSIFLQSLGMLIGLAIMFVLAAWEEDIKKAWS